MAGKGTTLKDLFQEEDPRERIKELSFEEGVKLLDELVEKVETGTLPLNAAITSYERGVLMLEHLRGLIAGAEAKIKMLQKNDAKGGGTGS